MGLTVRYLIFNRHQIFEFRALCDISCYNFQELLEIMGLFLELSSLLYIQDLKEMVSAYGGSTLIQCKTTEYLIPKVRLERQGF